MSRLMEMVSMVLQESEGIQEWEEFRMEMTEMLSEQGYQPLEINLALAIAQRIHEQMVDTTRPTVPLKSNRVFQILEQQKLLPESRGHLDALVRRGYITPEAKMEIVDRILMLDEGPMGLDELKALIQMYVEEEPPDEENCWLPPTLH